MSYIECYVAAVPRDNEKEYRKKSTMMGKVFRDHGALRAVDCWGSNVPGGELTSFPLAVKATEEETVCLGWVEWPSKEARDEGMPKAMADDRVDMSNIPFDGKRMIFAGFEKFSDL
ncbi:MAG: DUF1428 domain-containing protein [Rhizobiaceae bacterium]